MKYLSVCRLAACFLLISFLAGQTAVAQKNIGKTIQKKWIKTELRMADGSKVYRPDLVNMQLQYNFFSPDSLRTTLDGRTSFERYDVKDSVLSYGNVRFFIKELSDVKLVLREISREDDSEKIELELIPQRFYDLGFEPIMYQAKNGDEVYVASENHVYPYFVNSQYPAIVFISEKFDFPEWKKGNFLARFIITKNGELKGVRVEESTNQRYDEALVAAIKKTIGMWRPAEFDGQKVTCEVLMEFKMDFPNYDSKTLTAEQKLNLSQEQVAEGNYFFNEKLYRMAVTSYSEAIENDFKNVEAYYRRAAAYVLLKEKDKACEDYEQLMFLEQTKATELYNKYCKKPETTNK